MSRSVAYWQRKLQQFDAEDRVRRDASSRTDRQRAALERRRTLGRRDQPQQRQAMPHMHQT